MDKRNSKKRTRKQNFWNDFLKALEREVPLIKEARKNKNYFITLIIFFLLIVGFPLLGTLIFVKLFKPLVDIFVANFGALAIGMFFAVLLICLIFFGLIALSKIMLGSISTVKQRWVAFFIYALTITVFLTGSVFIHAIVGAPDTEWQLFNQGIHIADISCKDSQGSLIENHEITCEIKSVNSKFDLKDVYGEITIELQNKTKILENFPDFMAPENINHISINLNATSMGKPLKLDTGFYPKFYSESGEKERKKDFLTYFFGLLFITLITIPQLIIKIFKGLKKERP